VPSIPVRSAAVAPGDAEPGAVVPLGVAAGVEVGAVVGIQDASGKEIAQAVTAKDGTFRIDLAPGVYTVVAQAATGMMGTPAPQNVTVTEGVVTAIKLDFDTGIR
jgi:hypothetical protein